jgi:hypothetical protein
LAGTILGKKPDVESLNHYLSKKETNNKCSERNKKYQLWTHGALLPVRIILREFAARGLPENGQKATAKHLWDFILTELEACSLRDYAPYLRKHLIEVGGLMMFDGLDEVPEANRLREQIKNVVESFSSNYPKCRVLVTSRTYSYQKQDWQLSGFVTAILRPFTSDQIVQFIERWYSHSHIANIRSINEENLYGQAELLKHAVLSNQRLLDLAERPLLLTLISSLHAWRGGLLPEKREELFNEAVDLLLNWWETPKIVRNLNGEIINPQPSLTEWLNIDKKKVRNLLNYLAFKAHSAQPNLVGTADIVEGDLIPSLLKLSNNPDVKLSRLVEYLSERAGLLLSRGEGIYTFPHRTFQEYLAACYLTDHGYPEQVAKLAKREPDRWREVCLLAGAKATRGGAFALWPLLDELCEEKEGKLSLHADLWGGLLAGQVLLENKDLKDLSKSNQEKVNKVRDWQVKIISNDILPVIERVAAGNVLADLGDPRFREDLYYLPDDDWLGFVKIPSGKFWMGSDPKIDEFAKKEEQPNFQLYLPLFYIAKYPVILAQWAKFVEEEGYHPRNSNSLRGKENHPVVWVTWYEALKFCDWLNESLMRRQ